jgi:hypothetical protein
LVQEVSTLPPQPSYLDERIIVPAGAARPEIVPPPSRVSEELVEKDVFLTGEVNFLANEELREKQARKNLIDRAYSIVLHAAVLLLLIFPAEALQTAVPQVPPSRKLRANRWCCCCPPARLKRRHPLRASSLTPPKVKVDPRILRQIAPPEPVAPPQPVQPKTQPKELPSAPAPQTQRKSAPSSDALAEAGGGNQQHTQT